MVICPNCKHHNRDTARHCEECGWFLQEFQIALTPDSKPAHKGPNAWLRSLGVGVLLLPTTVSCAATIAFIMAFVPTAWAVFRFIFGNVTDLFTLVIDLILSSFIWVPIGIFAGAVAAVGGGIVGAVIGGIGLLVNTLTSPLSEKVRLILISAAMGGAGAAGVGLTLRLSPSLSESFSVQTQLWLAVGAAAFGVAMGVFHAFVSSEEH